MEIKITFFRCGNLVGKTRTCFVYNTTKELLLSIQKSTANSVLKFPVLGLKATNENFLSTYFLWP